MRKSEANRGYVLTEYDFRTLSLLLFCSALFVITYSSAGYADDSATSRRPLVEHSDASALLVVTDSELGPEFESEPAPEPGSTEIQVDPVAKPGSSVTKTETELEKIGRIESSKRAITRGYLKAVTATDNFISGRPLEQEINESFLKLESKYTSFTNDEPDSGGVALKGRLELPKTENKLRLFFDTDDDINHSLEERNRPVSTGETVRRRNSILGMELSPISKLGGWKLSLRLGARMDDVPRALTRIHLRNGWPISKNWRFNVRNDLWYLGASGPGNTTRFELVNKWSDVTTLRFQSEFEYRDEFQTTDFVVQTVLSQVLSPRSILYYRLGRLSSYDDEIQESKIFFSLNYRRQIYKDWIYFSISPEIFTDPEEKNLREHFSLTGKLEFFFAE